MSLANPTFPLRCVRSETAQQTYLTDLACSLAYSARAQASRIATSFSSPSTWARWMNPSLDDWLLNPHTVAQQDSTEQFLLIGIGIHLVLTWTCCSSKSVDNYINLCWCARGPGQQHSFLTWVISFPRTDSFLASQTGRARAFWYFICSHFHFVGHSIKALKHLTDKTIPQISSRDKWRHNMSACSLITSKIAHFSPPGA